MKKILLFTLLVCSTFPLISQTTIASQGFETGDSWTISSGATNISTLTGTGDSPADQRIRTGSNSWQVNNSTETLELSSQDVSMFSFSKVIVNLSSTSANSQNGADGSDEISVFVSLDGGATFPSVPDIIISGTGNAKWSYDSDLIASTSAGTPMSFTAPQGGTDTNNYSKIEITVPDGTTSVALRIVAENNSANEFWNIDDISLEGIENGSPIAVFDDLSNLVLEPAATVTLPISVTLSNYIFAQNETVTLGLFAGPQSTAETDDYLLPADISFTDNETVQFNLEINPDADFDDETLEIQLIYDQALGIATSPTVHVVTIIDDDIAPTPPIVINEILADPGNVIDANQDGVFSPTDDEFVEIVNTTNQPIDISGYTISDGGAIRFTFPANTLLPGGWAATVFGGGSASSSIPGLTFISGGLSLNNTNETVKLEDGTGARAVLDMHSYGSEANSDESIARSPDFTGEFTRHETIATNPVSASPGRSNTSGAALPVKLETFSGKFTSRKHVDLHWSTSTEINNDYFVLERSTDRIDFREIGMIQGSGTTSETQDYSFTDRTPAAGINYYRLAQYDFNGEMEYHPVIAVRTDRKTTSIHPTLAHAFLNLEVNDKSSILIMNANGQVVLRKNIDSSQRLNISDLSPGIYTIAVNTDSERQVHRFIKQ